MESLKLITCIVEKDFTDKTVNAALKAGAEGATMFHARGTGVRQKIGLAGQFIQEEKEIILIVAKSKKIEKIFRVIIQAAKLNEPGKGFAYINSIDKAIGFINNTEEEN